MRTVLVRITLCIALAGCANAPEKHAAAPAPTPTPLPTQIGPEPNDNLNAVAWTQTAIEHDLVYREVFRDAGEKLRIALKDARWDALPKNERKQPLSPKLKPAVIVDIDETVLDNSPFQARLVEQGKEFDESSWLAWCHEKRARALPGALEFAQRAAKRGVTVFYISNRAQDLNEATLENLRAAGFPIAENETVFLGLGAAVDGCEQHGTSKSCRRELVGRTHRILMQFGDQIGDFVDVRSNTAEGRRAAMEPYAGWIGERWFVLPNPTYGSWESSLVNDDWSRPAAARREAKRSALHVD